MALCSLSMALLLAAPVASAADRIYWANDDGDSIAWANLDGSGGGILNTPGATEDAPNGMAIDSATGTIFWANYDAGDVEGTGTTLSYARLDGSGGGNLTMGGFVSGPHGVAINPLNRRIYWVNYHSVNGPPFYGGQIRYASLNGTGTGISGGISEPINETIPTAGPRSLAIDPGAGRIYWANYNHDSAEEPHGDSIAYANLNGTGGGTIVNAGIGETGPGLPNRPEGVAVDPVTNRIYWSNFTSEIEPHISYAGLPSGAGAADLNTAGATVDAPHGVVIDPDARRIYWPNFFDDDIFSANLSGGGGAILATPGVAEVGPALPVILKTPLGVGGPTVFGGSEIGDALGCTQGSWAPDMVSSLLYRAPQSVTYQWSRNGANLAGATSATYTPSSGGDYRCAVTAHNAAGSATQSSAPHTVNNAPSTGGNGGSTAGNEGSDKKSASNAFSFGGLTRNLQKGTATLVVEVPQAGTLTMNGGGVKRVPSGGAKSRGASKDVAGGEVVLVIKSKGKARKRLNRTGKAKVTIKVTYRPDGGDWSSQTTTVVLKKSIDG